MNHGRRERAISSRESGEGRAREGLDGGPRVPGVLRARRATTHGLARRAAAAILLALVLVASPPASARDGAPPSTCTLLRDPAERAACVAEAMAVPDDAVLEERGATIGEIVIHAGDVFDTTKKGENHRLFRLANRLHIDTRPQVVTALLTFRGGDRYSSRVLAESERILRESPYLFDAWIRPLRYHDNVVDVEIETRDIWTLRVGAGYKREGGANTTHFALQDSNFLGWGKDLTLERTSDVDRTSNLIRYRDPTFWGTRVNLELWHSDNTDGQRDRFRLSRPFYSYDTRWAAGLNSLFDDRIESYYSLGKASARKLRHRQTFIEGYVGISSGRVGNATRRLRLGGTYDENLFDDVPGGLGGPKASKPADRELVYPWVDFELLRDGYIKVTDLDRIGRTEDVNLGLQTHARLGWAPRGWNDRSQAIYQASASMGFQPGPGQLLLAESHVSGRWSREQQVENLLVGGSARWYWRDWRKHVLFASVAVDATENRDVDNQLLLGGDNGLRGYPLRYQDGDRRVLVTLEQRFYTDWDVFHVVNVGGAVFADAGRAWFVNDRFPNQTLRDVGLGLRLSSSRSSGTTMVHVDVAFPLDGDDSIDRVQFLVSTAESF